VLAVSRILPHLDSRLTVRLTDWDFLYGKGGKVRLSALHVPFSAVHMENDRATMNVQSGPRPSLCFDYP
jgi:hypothetical protein